VILFVHHPLQVCRADVTLNGLTAKQHRLYQLNLQGMWVVCVNSWIVAPCYAVHTWHMWPLTKPAHVVMSQQATMAARRATNVAHLQQFMAALLGSANRQRHRGLGPIGSGTRLLSKLCGLHCCCSGALESLWHTALGIHSTSRCIWVYLGGGEVSEVEPLFVTWAVPAWHLL